MTRCCRGLRVPARLALLNTQRDNITIFPPTHSGLLTLEGTTAVLPETHLLRDEAAVVSVGCGKVCDGALLDELLGSGLVHEVQRTCARREGERVEKGCEKGNKKKKKKQENTPARRKKRCF